MRIWPYSLSEYLYVLSKSGLTLKHRTYALNQSDENFLNEQRKTVCKKGSLVYWEKKIPIGLRASIGAPILGEIAKPILGKISGRGRRKRRALRRRRK